MKVVSLSGVGTMAGQRFQQLKSHRFFSDRLSVTVLTLNLILAAITIAVLVLRVRPSSVPVPVHYSSLVGFDRLGPWWQLYSIGLFSLAVIITNTALAITSFTRSRITSFFLMSGAFVVAIFALIISLAITAVV
jgi:hypothetical protein